MTRHQHRPIFGQGNGAADENERIRTTYSNSAAGSYQHQQYRGVGYGQYMPQPAVTLRNTNQEYNPREPMLPSPFFQLLPEPQNQNVAPFYPLVHPNNLRYQSAQNHLYPPLGTTRHSALYSHNINQQQTAATSAPGATAGGNSQSSPVPPGSSTEEFLSGILRDIRQRQQHQTSSQPTQESRSHDDATTRGVENPPPPQDQQPSQSLDIITPSTTTTTTLCMAKAINLGTPDPEYVVDENSLLPPPFPQGEEEDLQLQVYGELADDGETVRTVIYETRYFSPGDDEEEEEEMEFPLFTTSSASRKKKTTTPWRYNIPPEAIILNRYFRGMPWDQIHMWLQALLGVVPGLDDDLFLWRY